MRSVATAGKVLVSVVLVASFVLAIEAFAHDERAWPCDREDRVNAYPDLPDEGGYETPRDAVRAWLPLAAERSGIDLSRLEAAVEQTSGPDRFEPERNRIYLNGQIFAELSLSAPTGGWHVIYVWGCRQSLQ
jgi:hypothetical protein